MAMLSSTPQPRNRLARWWESGHWVEALIALTLGLVSLVMLYPFLWMVFSSFKTGADILTVPLQLLPRQWTLASFNRVVNTTSLPRSYINSLGLSTAIVATVLLTSSLGGYTFARLEFPGRDILFVFTLSTTMVPFLTLLIPLYIVMQWLGLLNSYMAIWVPSLVSSFGIFLCRQFIYTIPRDLYEAAKIDGSGDFAIYWRIILPLIKPVLSALAIFTFLSSFNSYLWPLVVLNDEKMYTLPLVLAQLRSTFGGTNYHLIMPGSLLACIPTLVIYLLFQRNFVRGIALSGLKA
jgi:ABC-type glycerol-3-phosphate transport system permease component